MDFSAFEEKTGIVFNDKELLKRALTHRSYLNEHPKAGGENNERLEFLGDAVLELVVTEELYQQFPDKPEGELTAYRAALVNTTSLSHAASELAIQDYLLLSRGEARDTGKARQFITANAVEAVIGAIYLDQGYEAARAFIEKYLLSRLEEILRDQSWKDAKSRFQEQAQEIAGVTPSYNVLQETGPDHDKQFVVGVFLDSEQIATGEGRSKQDAEQDAAQKALEAKSW